MKTKYWKELIIQAVQKAETGDIKQLDLLAQNLEMLDETKQLLRDKGYGFSGLDIFKTVEEIPSNIKQKNDQ